MMICVERCAKSVHRVGWKSPQKAAHGIGKSLLLPHCSRAEGHFFFNNRTDVRGSLSAHRLVFEPLI